MWDGAEHLKQDPPLDGLRGLAAREAGVITAELPDGSLMVHAVIPAGARRLTVDDELVVLMDAVAEGRVFVLPAGMSVEAK